MSTSHDKRTLEDFAVKGLHLGKMTGVLMGAHAISDCFLLMHSGVGCKYKTAAQAAEHDLGEHPNVREAWTQVSEAHLVAGCSDRIGPFARAWWERRRSGFMVVVSAYFLELTGDDVRSAVEEVERTLPDCEMAYIETMAPNHAFFDGYAAVLLEAMKRMDWSGPPTNDRQATIIGHFFHRYENDTKADLTQLRGLVKAAGLEPGPILLSGVDYAELKTAPAAKFVVELPYTRPHDRKIRRLCKRRELVSADLPMGLAGTQRFVRTLAAAAGSDLAKVEAWLKTQTEATQFSLQRFTESLRKVSVAVFADTPHAAGLVTLLLELGMDVPLVGLRDHAGCLGGRTAFLETLAKNGHPELDRMEVLQDPSLRRMQARVSDLCGDGLNGVIGSSHELDYLKHAAQDSPGARDLVLIETGFPSNTFHAVYQVPTFGFAGAAAWAHRLREAFAQPRIGRDGLWMS
jgi:nitrogenase molybdenum-iron protein alpha/beta subunit